jgi:hypothetical protein
MAVGSWASASDVTIHPQRCDLRLEYHRHLKRLAKEAYKTKENRDPEMHHKMLQFVKMLDVPGLFGPSSW